MVEEVEPRWLLRVDECARRLGLGRTKIYELIGTGEIPSVRIGGVLRIPAEALREALRQQATVTSASTEAR
jgi:excisionase family DNA binding protein